MSKLAWICVFICAVIVNAGCDQTGTTGGKSTLAKLHSADPKPDSNGSTDDRQSVKSATEVADTKSIELVETDWDGLQKLIQEHKGKIVVVDIWSTACEPCMKEFPHLIRLQEKYPDQIVSISFDVDFAGMKNKPVGYYREQVIDFLGSQPESKVLHRMSTTSADVLFDQIKLDSIPAVEVYGTDGQLAKRFHGSSGGSEGVSYVTQVIPFVDELTKNTPTSR